MEEIGTEVDWKDLAHNLRSAPDNQKAQVAISVSSMFSGVPEAREWLANYLRSEDAQKIPTYGISFLLRTFITNPSPEEITLVADNFWKVDTPDLLPTASLIIEAGEGKLSEQEKIKLAEKAREIFDNTKQNPEHDNFGGKLIVIAGKFAPQIHEEWILEELDNYPIPPVYTTQTIQAAVEFGIKFSPEKLVNKLMDILKRTSPGNVVRKTWLIGDLSNVLEIIKPDDLKLLSQSLGEIVKLPPKTIENCFAFKPQLVTRLTQKFPEEMKKILHKLP